MNHQCETGIDKLVSAVKRRFVASILLLPAVWLCIYLLHIPTGYLDAARHAAMVSVSVAAAWLIVIVPLDLTVAYLCLRKTRRDSRVHEYKLEPNRRTLLVRVDRHIAQNWTLLVLLMTVLILFSSPYVVIPVLVFLLLVGPALASWIGYWIITGTSEIGPVDLSYADLRWLRHPVFLAVTDLAIVCLMVYGRVCSQPRVFWFGVCVILTSLFRMLSWTMSFAQIVYDRLQKRGRGADTEEALPRLVKLVLKSAHYRYRRVKSGQAGQVGEAAGNILTQDVWEVESKTREAEQEEMELHPRPVDSLLMVGVAALVLAGPLTPVFQSSESTKHRESDRVQHWIDPPSGPVDLSDADVAVFIVADNHFRALDGKGGVGQAPVIDRIVPVAVRPVELDLLSGATLARFGRLFQEARKRRPNLRWAHLGDVADLACRSEMVRLKGVIDLFGPQGAEALAGFAPGNHDCYYTGNFSWHPDWSDSGSCPGGPQRRSGEEGLNELIKTWTSKSVGIASDSASERKDYLTRMVKLGVAGEEGKAQVPIYGIFLDTADYSQRFWLGAAGVEGTISRDQKNWVLDHLPPEKEDYRVIIFQHHPYPSFSYLGKLRYRKIVERLGKRLLAVVAAHTHGSAAESTDLGVCPIAMSPGTSPPTPSSAETTNLEICQFIVGSTTDPPQEAGLLSVSLRNDKYMVRFWAIPAVDRRVSQVPDGGLADVLDGGLADVPDGGLVEAPAAYFPPLGDCRNEILAVSRCKDIKRTWPEPKSREEQIEQQQCRAQALLACCNSERGPGLSNPPGSLVGNRDDRNPFKWFGLNCDAADPRCTDLAKDEKYQNKLVCLAWAASILQGHKHQGWSFERALHLSLERLATFESWQYPPPEKVAQVAPKDQ